MEAMGWDAPAATIAATIAATANAMADRFIMIFIGNPRTAVMVLTSALRRANALALSRSQAHNAGRAAAVH